jgi:hypothetical protein
MTRGGAAGYGIPGGIGLTAPLAPAETSPVTADLQAAPLTPEPLDPNVGSSAGQAVTIAVLIVLAAVGIGLVVALLARRRDIPLATGGEFGGGYEVQAEIGPMPGAEIEPVETRPVDADLETTPVDADLDAEPVDTDLETEPIDPDPETEPVDADPRADASTPEPSVPDSEPSASPLMVAVIMAIVLVGVGIGLVVALSAG